jgi:transmembrane sensor
MMNDWFSDTLEYLLQNPDFISWARGDQPQDDPLWENWLAEDAARREVLDRAREMVLSIDREGRQFSDSYIDERVGRALAIAKRMESDNRRAKQNRWFHLSASGWTMAASLFIVLGIGFATFRIYKNNKQFSAGDIASNLTEGGDLVTEVSNHEAAVRYVRLPDGSAIVLHKNSRVRFPKKFGASRRAVYLTGDAFFEVVKNPEQPFFVYANELVSKVHGTSFSIRAGEQDEHVTVTVKTGKVSVFAKKDSRSKEYETDKALAALVLTSNQQATFERSRSRLLRSVANGPVLLDIPIEKQVFTYLETPVGEVFDSLGKAYGVQISYDRDTMSNCSITASLGDEPLENKLRWICTILEATYEVNEGKISITGNPCK